ncbi:MAG: hypothetical protein U9R33_04795, partial [candidate division NC10 bacterium]|nr:hypothetical protein [candidate division NC10 bacterium]
WLYDGTSAGLIFDTLAHRKVADRDFPVTALCSHRGRLYDGGPYGFIYETLDGRMVVGGIKAVTAMVSVPPDLFQALWSRTQHL